MACEQQLKKSQGTNMLPNVVATEQQSLIVVKKLLAIAVSCITYLRGLFPEKAYGSKYVEEQKVMILREERSCPGASQIVQWMHGCFDALQKKYLRLVVLSIYTDPENPQKVTECYQFRIQYTDKGPQMEFESRNIDQVAKMTCGNIRKASILLVRKLYMLMQNLGPLPDSVCLNMKLSYYDEVTPQDYEPPGFKEGDSDSMMFEKEPVNLTMGEIVTPFHTLKVDVTTERERLEQIPEDEPVSEAQRVALKMEADKAASISNSRPIKLCQLPVLKDRKDHNHNKADYLEVPLRSQKEMKVCEEKLDSSHIPEIDSLVKKTSDLGVTIKRTRSGRVIKSAMCQLPVLKDRKDHNHNKADYLEVPLRSQKEMKVCEEKLDSSHIPEIDSLVKKTSDLGVTIKRTRSGRVIKSAMMSQFAFPCSQDKPSVPKKRKFSEPKEQF